MNGYSESKTPIGAAGPFALATAVLFLTACAGGSTKSKANEGIEYSSVAAARAALETRDGVKVAEEDGWALYEEPETGTVWTFTPPQHSAHPTVIKRILVKKPGKDDIDMYVRCEAPGFACQALRRKLELQNTQLTESPLRLYQKPTGAAADLPPIGGLLRR